MNTKNIPLPEFFRPKTLENFFGQEHITARNKILYNSIMTDNIQSYLFWGPPGSGKTTLAAIIANKTSSRIIMLDSITANTQKLKEVFAEAEQYEGKTILFIDEIHRFNKKQQDIFLPYVEQGKIFLICATTENPSFELNSQLLSRLKILKLQPLSKKDITNIINNVISKITDWNNELENIIIDKTIPSVIADLAKGDARQALSILETALIDLLAENEKTLTEKRILESAQSVYMRYDKKGEEHYNIISALHKSLRGSDIDASIYWCVRMLEGGEDPLYICRRLIRMAAEDVGVADTNALTVALNAFKTYTILGSPEGELAIIEAVIYLASCPKSNSVYNAYNTAKKFVNDNDAYPVPLHISNAPTKLMKNLGYSKGYVYPFDCKYNYSGQNFFPDEIKNAKFYFPYQFGYEKEIQKRIEFWKNLKKNK
jgi:putative ATPase